MEQEMSEPNQGLKYIWIIIATVIITTMMVGGGVYSWQNIVVEREKIKALEIQAELKDQIFELRDQIDQLQQQLKQQVSTEIIPSSFKPKEGWEKYFPTPSTTTLVNESVNEIRSLLGEPPILVRSIAVNPKNNREIWIYIPYDYDPTGLYIYFKGNSVVKTKLDEFNGLVSSTVWQDDEFWFK